MQAFVCIIKHFVFLFCKAHKKIGHHAAAPFLLCSACLSTEYLWTHAHTHAHKLHMCAKSFLSGESQTRDTSSAVLVPMRRRDARRNVTPVKLSCSSCTSLKHAYIHSHTHTYNCSVHGRYVSILRLFQHRMPFHKFERTHHTHTRPYLCTRRDQTQANRFTPTYTHMRVNTYTRTRLSPLRTHTYITHMHTRKSSRTRKQ